MKPDPPRRKSRPAASRRPQDAPTPPRVTLVSRWRCNRGRSNGADDAKGRCRLKRVASPASWSVVPSSKHTGATPSGQAPDASRRTHRRPSKWPSRAAASDQGNRPPASRARRPRTGNSVPS